MVARTICSRRTGATPTFGLTAAPSSTPRAPRPSPAFAPASLVGWSTNYVRGDPLRQGGRWAFRSGVAAAAFGGPLGFQALERDLAVVGKGDGVGERVVAGHRADQRVHALA